MRTPFAVFALLTAACAAAPPVDVAVYDAPPGPGPARGMPDGCGLLLVHPPVALSELDMSGSDPFRKQRVRTARAGGNVLLVRSRQITPRRDIDCPASSPITDCPPAVGAWSDVVFEDWKCSAPGLAALGSGSKR